MTDNISNQIIELEHTISDRWCLLDIRKQFLNITHNSDSSYLCNLFVCGNGNPYILIDGPPFATGSPHFGHLLAGLLKDIETRYKTFTGFNVTKKVGWDTQGLPMEMQINKTLNITTKEDIYKVGLSEYCKACRKAVLTCADLWEIFMMRFARWANFEDPYTTMDIKFTEAVWQNFGLAYKNKLITSGYRISSYSTSLETGLSNFESSLNYKMRNDKTITFLVKLLNHTFDKKEVYIAVYTTTPWTLPGNMALAINKNLVYYLYLHESNKYIITIKKPKESHVIIKGSELIGLSYKPLFDFFDCHKNKQCYNIYHGDFVDNETGTGIVHCAPMFGESDFELCIANNIISKNGDGLNDYLTSTGHIEPKIGNFFDSNYVTTICYEFNKTIIAFIQNNMPDNFFETNQIHHNYPHCWRTDTPLIYRAIKNWTVNVSTFKDELIKLNEKINWYPKHVGSGRFKEWLENARDWNISRSRIWGTPIPLWKNINDPNDIICITSAKELEQYANLPHNSLTDLHRDYIDNIIININGNTYKRIDEVLDCWFDSGSVPAYYFPDKFIPCDFIAEGMDQTRGWFYTMLVIGYIRSKYLNNNNMLEPVYKNVMVNGIVLSDKGEKLSKRLNNYIDPNKLIDKYGVDALRLYLAYSPASYGGSLKFDDNGVFEISNRVLIQLCGTVNFVLTYKKVHIQKNTQLLQVLTNSKMDTQHATYTMLNFPDCNTYNHDLNLWIMYKTFLLEKQIHTLYENHMVSDVVSAIIDFVELFNNTYIKLMRPIFKNTNTDDTSCSNVNITMVTISFILLRLAYLIAPITPYFADYIFININTTFKETHDQISIHLTNYKDFYSQFITPYYYPSLYMLNKIKNIDNQIKLLDNIRILCQTNNHQKSKLLQHVVIISSNTHTLLNEIETEIGAISLQIINMDELKTKPINYIPEFDQKIMGQTFKTNKNAIIKHILSSQLLITQLYNNTTITITIDKNVYNISPNMVTKYLYTLTDEGDQTLRKLLHLNDKDQCKNIIGEDYIIYIDFSTTQYMQELFIIQEIARKFQRMRKRCKLIPSDPIKLNLECSPQISKLYITHKEEFKKITNHYCTINLNIDLFEVLLKETSIIEKENIVLSLYR